jgi:hypothetical protein
MHYKKIVVVPLACLLIGGVMYSLYAFINAFGALQENFLYDGTVTAKAEGTVMLFTSSAETIPMRIIEETEFANGLSLETINTGDCLKISASNSGSTITAKNVEKINCGTSYGYR